MCSGARSKLHTLQLWQGYLCLQVYITEKSTGRLCTAGWHQKYLPSGEAPWYAGQPPAWTPPMPAKL
jgi:hypothetical protein